MRKGLILNSKRTPLVWKKICFYLFYVKTITIMIGLKHFLNQIAKVSDKENTLITVDLNCQVSDGQECKVEIAHGRYNETLIQYSCSRFPGFYK